VAGVYNHNFTCGEGKMSIDYTVICYDEFDWMYADAQKEERLEALLRKFHAIECYPEVLAQWYRFIVISFGRTHPESDDEVYQILNNFGDGWYWYTDVESYILHKGH
jgi:hypothetical protein